MYRSKYYPQGMSIVEKGFQLSHDNDVIINTFLDCGSPGDVSFDLNNNSYRYSD